MDEKEERSPFRTLWLIPVQLLLDVILVFLGAYLDTRIVSPEATGHPAPALVLLFTGIAVAATVIITLYAVIRTVVLCIRRRKKKQ